MEGKAVPAPVPVDEEARLVELFETGLLDIPPDPRFDHYTSLVAQALDVPMALISLVDRTRQWFLSSCGLRAKETGRDEAFCSHAILEDTVLVIPDATQDPRFRTNPLVVGPPHIRAYAGAVLRGPQGRPIGTLCVVDGKARDWSPREMEVLLGFGRLVREEVLRRQARTRQVQARRRTDLPDPLTGLPLRSRFETELSDDLEGTESGALWVAQLQGLSEINSVWGRGVGDQVVRTLVERLRSFFSGLPRMGRVTSRTLAVWLPDQEAQGLDGRAAELLHALEAPVDLPDGAPFQPEISLGRARYPRHGETAEALVSRALHGLGAGQTLGGAGLCAFTLDLDARSQREQELRGRLAAAVRAGEIFCVYQPQVDARGRLVGAEALARWTDPDMGRVSPGEFIPLAERHGLIRPLTEALVGQVLVALRSGALRDARVAINLSPLLLQEEQCVQGLAAMVKDSGVPPERLILEITESSVDGFSNDAVEMLRKLRSMGFGLSLDDFGTGQSSLARLRELPFSELKVDRSFVWDMERSESGLRVMEAILRMAEALQLETVVEGVETQRQLDLLLPFRPGAFQGYFFGAPAELTAWAQPPKPPVVPVAEDAGGKAPPWPTTGGPLRQTSDLAR